MIQLYCFVKDRSYELRFPEKESKKNRRPALELRFASVCLVFFCTASTVSGASEVYSIDQPAPTVVSPSNSPDATSQIVTPDTVQPTPSPSETKRECQQGIPVALEWDAVGVHADAIEQVGLDETGGLAAPKDKHKAGWYKYGSKPGNGQGNVILDAHRYRDNSAVVPADFATRLGQVGVGSVLTVVMDNNSRCKFRITEVTPVIDKFDENTGYPALVTSHKLYQQKGPTRLVFITCAGDWNAAQDTSQQSSVAEGVPIN